MDGALSNNMLDLDKHTITISPFAGDADICPRGEMVSTPIEDCFGGQVRLSATTLAMNFFNASRLLNVVFPMSPEKLAELAEQGYDDAKRYLITRGLVVCRLHRTPSHFSSIAKRQRSISMNVPNRKSCASPPISDSGKSQALKVKKRRKILSTQGQNQLVLPPPSNLQPKDDSSQPNTSINSPSSETDLSTCSYPLYLGACTRLSNPNCQSCKSLVLEAMTSNFPRDLKVLFIPTSDRDEGGIVYKSISTAVYTTKLIYSFGCSGYEWVNDQSLDMSTILSHLFTAMKRPLDLIPMSMQRSVSCLQEASQIVRRSLDACLIPQAIIRQSVERVEGDVHLDMPFLQPEDIQMICRSQSNNDRRRSDFTVDLQSGVRKAFDNIQNERVQFVPERLKVAVAIKNQRCPVRAKYSDHLQREYENMKLVIFY